jgi:cytidine deaminase
MPRIYQQMTELSESDQALLAEAVAATTQSYAPYSKFRVGAAVRLEDNSIVKGFNIENASYPVCMCAEQTTISAVRTQHPGKKIQAMAITVRSANVKVNAPASPCGQCRQLLFEQEAVNEAPFYLVLRGETGPIWIFDSVSELLPFGFSGDML